MLKVLPAAPLFVNPNKISIGLPSGSSKSEKEKKSKECKTYADQGSEEKLLMFARQDEAFANK